MYMYIYISSPVCVPHMYPLPNICICIYPLPSA